MAHRPALMNEVVAASRDGKEVRERILFIDAATARAVLFDLDDPHAFPRWCALAELQRMLDQREMKPVDPDPFPFDERHDRHLSKRRKADREARWSIMEPILFTVDVGLRRLNTDLFDRKLRGQLVLMAAAAANTHPAVIREWLRQWWRRGQHKNALLSGFDRSGGRGKTRTSDSGKKRGRKRTYLPDTPGVNVTDDVRELLIKGGLEFHRKLGFSLREAYRLTLTKYFADPDVVEVHGGIESPVLLPDDELPSYDQFRFAYGSVRDTRAEYRARHGERAAVIKNEAKHGTFQGHATGPGSIYIIDATIADIYLLSELDPGQVIGRPVMYFVVDLYSQCIAGLYVGLEGPSWTGAMMALENAFSDKREYLKQYGFDPDDPLFAWPCAGVPASITADRGEVLSKASDRPAQTLEITITNCPKERPDLKAPGEGQFKLADDKVTHFQPGAVHKVRDRRRRDYRFDATYTTRSFTRLMILHALTNNNSRALRNWRPRDFPGLVDGDPTPLDLWLFGMREGTGQLKKYDPERVRLNLMRSDMATVSEDGITFCGLRYTSDELAAEGWFDDSNSRRPAKVEWCWDERNMGIGWVSLDAGRRNIECLLVEADAAYDGMTYYEVKDEQHRRKEVSLRGRRDEMQDRAAFDAQTAAVQQDAIRERDIALNGGRARIKGMRDARRRQRRAIAAEESGGTLPALSPADAAEAATAEEAGAVPFVSKPLGRPRPAYTPLPSDIDIL